MCHKWGLGFTPLSVLDRRWNAKMFTPRGRSRKFSSDFNARRLSDRLFCNSRRSSKYCLQLWKISLLTSLARCKAGYIMARPPHFTRQWGSRISKVLPQERRSEKNVFPLREKSCHKCWLDLCGNAHLLASNGCLARQVKSCEGGGRGWSEMEIHGKLYISVAVVYGRCIHSPAKRSSTFPYVLVSFPTVANAPLPPQYTHPNPWERELCPWQERGQSWSVSNVNPSRAKGWFWGFLSVIFVYFIDGTIEILVLRPDSFLDKKDTYYFLFYLSKHLTLKKKKYCEGKLQLSLSLHVYTPEIFL